jgi:FtsZ-binding cell division protein ZapB
MTQQPVRHSPAPYGDESLLRKLQASELERQRLLAELRNLSGHSETEVKSLRDANHYMHKELEEMRHHCSAVEDENMRMRQVAIEWQKFGQYTLSVMQNEVSDDCQVFSDHCPSSTRLLVV